ncbi:hypothetical protein QEN19_004369 [Hanseniaspora menglaensis]
MISDNELHNLSLQFGILLFILILIYGFVTVNFLEEEKEKITETTDAIGIVSDEEEEEAREEEKEEQKKTKNKKK